MALLAGISRWRGSLLGGRQVGGYGIEGGFLRLCQCPLGVQLEEIVDRSF